MADVSKLLQSGISLKNTVLHFSASTLPAKAPSALAPATSADGDVAAVLWRCVLLCRLLSLSGAKCCGATITKGASLIQHSMQLAQWRSDGLLQQCQCRAGCSSKLDRATLHMCWRARCDDVCGHHSCSRVLHLKVARGY